MFILTCLKFDGNISYIRYRYALNKTDGNIYSFSVAGSNLLMGETAPWDNTNRVNSGFNYDYTWYDILMPLSGMTNGDYEFVLRVETKDYIEYIDFKKSSSSGLKGSTLSSESSVTLSIDRNNKNRVTMTLNGFEALSAQDITE